jgi:hypothetical protein
MRGAVGKSPPRISQLRQNRQPASRSSRRFLRKHHNSALYSNCVQSIHIAKVVMKLSVLTATIILLAYASVGEAQLKCPVSTATPPCALTVVPSGYVCYSCAFTTPSPGTFSGGCDNTVTSGATSCTAQKVQIQGLYPGCTW